jgi:hypothetical protein
LRFIASLPFQVSLRFHGTSYPPFSCFLGGSSGLWNSHQFLLSSFNTPSAAFPVSIFIHPALLSDSLAVSVVYSYSALIVAPSVDFFSSIISFSPYFGPTFLSPSVYFSHSILSLFSALGASSAFSASPPRLKSEGFLSTPLLHFSESYAGDTSSGLSPLIQLLLVVFGALLLIAIGLAIFMWLRRRSPRHDPFSDGDEDSTKTVDFCTDSGLTVSSTLTTTLIDGEDSGWVAPSEPFDGVRFGFQL